MKRKGQAAMEFIMTYGWAIMVVLVVIGALAYFGVLSPSKILPDKCVFKAGLGCRDFQLLDNAGDLEAHFTLTNNFGNGFIVGSSDITATYKGDPADNCGNDAGGGWAGTDPGTTSPEDDVEFICVWTGDSPGVDQGAKILVDIDYTLSSGLYPKMASGDLSGRVQ